MAFEKLWFLQKAHAQLIADERGDEFAQLVDRVTALAEKETDVKEL